MEAYPEMKLLYDIAVLGLGHHEEKGRTGVFRVVENVALELAQGTALDLQFCASNYCTWAQEYLRSQPTLRGRTLEVGAAFWHADNSKVAMITRDVILNI